jgi:hypothetical protein
MWSKGHTDCSIYATVLTCDHCCQPFEGMPYRVKSEESGVVLLDMVVCYDCYSEARELGHRGGHLSTSIAAAS